MIAAWSSMKTVTYRAVVWVIILMSPGSSYNLLLVPSEVPSHMLTFIRAAELLTSRGYNVTVVLPSSYDAEEQTPTGFSVLRYQMDYTPILLTKKWQDKAIQAAVDGTFWQKTKFLIEEIVEHEALGHSMLKDEIFINKLKEQTFDYALVDMMPLTLYLPYKLSIPYAMLSYTCFVKYWPHQPSYIPSSVTHFSDSMTLYERLLNTLSLTMDELFLLMPDTKFSKKYIPEKPPRSAGDLTADVSACFILREHVTDFPRPMPPHAIYIGSLGTNVKPLPENIQSFVDEAAAGIIVVSFGTWLDRLPRHVYQIFLDSFGQLEQRVIMRCRLDPLPKAPENVMLLPWLPQNDLLAHNRTRLFIYHGGAGSLNEVTYHGVPSIVIPLIIDQEHNAAITRSKGYGVSAQLSELSVTRLVGLIQQVLKDKELLKRAREVSAILKQKPTSGIDALDYWLKYLIRYGDKYIKSKAQADLSYIAYKGYDVFAIVFVCTCFVSYLCLTCLWSFYCKKLRKLKRE